jgi:hypothetical protein
MAPAPSDDPRRIALDTALLCGSLLLPSVLAYAADTRTIHEVNVWSKPLKFQLSFMLHWLTIAVLLGLLDVAAWSRASLRWWLRVGGLASVLEVTYITLQAARGRASHFNFSTPLETILYYGLMGGAAVLMMLATIWVGWMLWRHPRRQERSATWLAGVLALVGGSVVTLLVTAPLAAGAVDGPGHWVGGVRNDAAGLPIFGWSTTGGDLRVPHFFAAHLTQALPLVGWLVDRLHAVQPWRWVWGAGLAGGAIVVATLVQALLQRPFWAG